MGLQRSTATTGASKNPCVCTPGTCKLAGVRVALLVVVLGCSDPARPQVAPVAPAAPTPPSPPRAAAPHPACKELLRTHRETLPLGREVAISSDGRGIYRGSSIDHFQDGTSANVLSLELFGSPWLPDDRDHAFHPIGDHCVRLISSTGDRVELEVALQQEHQYDSHRCHVGCCPPGGSTAPDGTEECCFCSDVP